MNLLEKIENDLKDGRKFLVGNQYSLADIVATCILGRVHLGYKETKFSPKVQKYWISMKERESFTEADITHELHDF